jgi:hypothetical protein
MGLFSTLRNKLMGISAADGHFFDDEETQRATTDAVAKQVAQLFESPNIKLRDDGGEIHITGTYRGRAARVVFDITFGKVKTELKMLVADSTDFSIGHDSTPAEVYAAGRKNRDEWDNHDDELKAYVARHVCYSGDPTELTQRRTIWESFAPELQASIVKMAEQWHGSLRLDDGTVEVSPWEGILGRPDAAKVIQAHLELAQGAAMALERRAQSYR